tara:strand:+ start:626 stop:1522 length:897 start_codon:yes stop_codon:yes gene_type:complete
MSNDVSIFKNGGAIPAHFKNAELSATTRALMGGTSARRLSIKGNIFRMVVGGQEIAKNEDRSMNIIIARAAPETSRQFYSAAYQEGIALIPSCWSNDGVQPDKGSESPQSTHCETCPQNIKGSAKHGQSRACKYSHRLAVLLENDTVNGELYELSLASTSLFGKGATDKMPLKQYAKLMGSNGLNITDIVTEMRFDTDSPTPKMVFRAVRGLTVEELEAVAAHGASPEAKMAVTLSYQPASTRNAEPEGLTMIAKPPKEAAPKEPAADGTAEPTVREKKPATTPNPGSMDDVLREWGN